MSFDNHKRLANKIRATIVRGVVTLRSVATAGDFQRWHAEGLYGTSYADLEHIQPAGFASSPAPGDLTECLIAEIGGDASHLVALAVMGDATKTISANPGEAVVYSPANPATNTTTSEHSIVGTADETISQTVGLSSATLNQTGVTAAFGPNSVTIDATGVNVTAAIAVKLMGAVTAEILAPLILLSPLPPSSSGLPPGALYRSGIFVCQV